MNKLMLKDLNLVMNEAQNTNIRIPTTKLIKNFYSELVKLGFEKEDTSNLTTQPGISAQLIVTAIEGNIGRYIRSKFKVSPSTYIENVWELLSISIFKN